MSKCPHPARADQSRLLGVRHQDQDLDVEGQEAVIPAGHDRQGGQKEGTEVGEEVENDPLTVEMLIIRALEREA